MTRSKILDGLPCVVLFCCTAVAAQASQLVSIDDVKGDDHGAGGLIYPNRDDIGPGDLDLVRISAEQRVDGIWFSVEMAQPVRSPVGRVTETGQTPIDRIARNGFYTFNVDIYIDTDRIAGLGETSTLPGRGVTVDRNYGWEKAIVLTPRPGVAATMLQMHYDNEFEAELRARQGRVSKPELQELQGRSETRVRDMYYFPDKVRVNGRRIEFLVPLEFLGGVPSQSWAYTAIVTGADLEQTGRPGQLGAGRSRMMTMGVGRGVQESLFGIRGDADAATPPVVDILS
ncbi:MAG TPA: glucodextranase DOMON-like domain-containing protein, partial [Steroidobacteraceae bacterium]|nr:glucodextranase DOMON-like domain-containing protein [Steroidobacteraceae bacterium]